MLQYHSMDRQKKTWFSKFGIPILVLAGIIGLIILVVILWREPLMSLFTDRDHLRDTIKETGAFGPLVYIVVQIIQTIVAPIPGQVIGIAGGAIFGWMGLIWGLIGSIIGAYIVFKLVRRFGRPLVEKLISKKTIKKLDFVIERRGTMTLFVMFLLPIFPDSIMCYLAGLTKIPIKTLMVLWIAGRVPTALVNNLIGEGMSGAMIRPTIAIILICAIVTVILYMKRRQISAFVASEKRLDYLKKNWPYSPALTIWFGTLLLLVFAAIFILIMKFPTI